MSVAAHRMAVCCVVCQLPSEGQQMTELINAEEARTKKNTTDSRRRKHSEISKFFGVVSMTLLFGTIIVISRSL
ncbi:unnamed protein product [Chilo suppressalis]|uniref:Uncharacterized protein n=1 Tax=Chilo suppressalis TaxID=168631 RepID=A0ABN8EAM7_CHISP|nr:unnamed protein product [Chilo suppressalis]